MNWTFDDIYNGLSEQVSGLYESIRRESEEGGLGVLLSPVEPYNSSPLLAPLVAAGGVIGMVMLSGLALGSFAVAMASFLAVFYLLTEIFGYEMTLAPFPQDQPSA